MCTLAKPHQRTLPTCLKGSWVIVERRRQNSHFEVAWRVGIQNNDVIAVDNIGETIAYCARRWSPVRDKEDMVLH